MSRVAYAFGGVLGGSGIGRIAGHAARGVHRAGLLDRAVAWAADGDPVPRDRLTTVPLGEHASLLPYYYKDLAFDLISERAVGTPELLHGWNNMCLRTIRRVADHGGVTVVERASTHPAVQRELVEAEYRRHGVDEEFVDERHYRRAVAELEEADAIFVPSAFVYDSFLDRGFAESDLVEIPFGVDTETFRPPADPGRPDGPFVGLFVGALSLRKGIQYLLPAWQRADVDGELRLAGQVTDAAESVVAEYREDPSIRFLGWVEDTATEYRNASAFLFPSIEEGSALVSYEAMAAALPSVVTPNAGSLVADGEHGHVVEPRDVDALADAIERLAASAERRREMGRAARERVEDYTWEAYGDRVAEAHRGVLH